MGASSQHRSMSEYNWLEHAIRGTLGLTGGMLAAITYDKGNCMS